MAKPKAKPKKSEKLYVIAEDSKIDRVQVDDKYLERRYPPVALTEDQLDRVEQIGVKLVEADEQSGEEE